MACCTDCGTHAEGRLRLSIFLLICAQTENRHCGSCPSSLCTCGCPHLKSVSTGHLGPISAPLPLLLAQGRFAFSLSSYLCSAQGPMAIALSFPSPCLASVFGAGSCKGFVGAASPYCSCCPCTPSPGGHSCRPVPLLPRPLAAFLQISCNI